MAQSSGVESYSFPLELLNKYQLQIVYSRTSKNSVKKTTKYIVKKLCMSERSEFTILDGFGSF